jgi:hypothetical protein
VSTSFETLEDAARLLSFGLRPMLRPGRDPDYAELLQRYRSNGTFREHVAVIARGLGLVVLGETELGLVLGAEEGGPFALRLADYRRSGLGVEERMCHGLIQLAVAAWFFPTAQSLEDPDAIAGARLSGRRLAEYLVGICKELEARAEEDPDAGAPELQEAWRAILARAETRSTPDGRRSSSTLAGMIGQALEALERGGLLRKVDDADGGTWQALGAYRLQVRELAAHEAAMLVRQAALVSREVA